MLSLLCYNNNTIISEQNLILNNSTLAERQGRKATGTKLRYFAVICQPVAAEDRSALAFVFCGFFICGKITHKIERLCTNRKTMHENN